MAPLQSARSRHQLVSNKSACNCTLNSHHRPCRQLQHSKCAACWQVVWLSDCETPLKPGLCAGDCSRSQIAVTRQCLAHRRKTLPCGVQQLHQMEKLQLACDVPSTLVELPRPEGPSHLSVGCSAAREMCLMPPRPWPANRELLPHAAGRNAAAKRVTVSVSSQASVTHKR